MYGNSERKSQAMVPAGQLRRGDQLVTRGIDLRLTVVRVEPHGDGSLRVFHTLGEFRATPSVMVRVAG